MDTEINKKEMEGGCVERFSKLKNSEMIWETWQSEEGASEDQVQRKKVVCTKRVQKLRVV